MKELRISLAGILALVFIVLTFAAFAQGATIQVPSNYATIQAALDAARNGDTVIVAKGIYKGAGNKDLDFKGKAITLESESGPAETIIDCEGIGRGFYFHSGETRNSVLKGFTIKNGSPGGDLIQIGRNAQTGEKLVHVDVQKDAIRSSNDGDPAIEPGEFMGIDIVLKNNSVSPVNNVVATLKSSDTRVVGMVPIYTSPEITNWKEVNMASTGIPVNYGIIYGNSTKSLFYQFVKINSNFIPLGDSINFTLEIRSDNSVVGTDNFSVKVGASIIVDRVDVDEDIKPGTSGEIDVRIRNISSGVIENIRVDVDTDNRDVDITEDQRVDINAISSGSTQRITPTVSIEPGFAGYVHFIVRIEVNRILVNTETFSYYFGMRSQYISNWIVDDDNRNGIAEPGERIALQVVRWNPTDRDAINVEATLSTTDNHIVLIREDRGDYNNILAHDTKEARYEYDFTIADINAFSGIPDFDLKGYEMQFKLSVEEDGEFMGEETFTMRIGGMMRYLPPEGFNELMMTISDSKDLDVNNDGDGMPEPGEVIALEITLENIWIDYIDNVEGNLDSDNDVRFIVDYGDYGRIRDDRTGTREFLVKIDSDFEGNKIVFEIDMEGRVDGIRKRFGLDRFSIPVQNVQLDIGTNEITTVASTGSGTLATSSPNDGFGGAIACLSASSPTIRDNIIMRNTATSNGGGIFCGDGSSPLIINNVISGNSAGVYGGGIGCNNVSSPLMINNTIYGNTAGTQGGGIRCQNSSFPTVLNSILWGNTPTQIYIDSGASLDITYSDIQSAWPGLGNINAYPQFVNTASDDYHLMDNSPCIAVGIMAPNVPATDVENNPRPNPSSSKPDMGAYESHMPSLPLTVSNVTASSGTQGTNGLEISITGTNFTSGATVSFSGTGIAVTSTSFVDSTKLTAKINISIGAPTGFRNVIVTNPGGQIAIGTNMFQVSSSAAVTLKVDAIQMVGKDSTFLADVKAEDVNNLAGFQMEVTFTPSILEVVKVEEGTFLKSGASTFWQEPVINNTNGSITQIASLRFGSGVSGSGILVRVTFKAKANGESPIKLANAALSDSSATLIPVAMVDTIVKVSGAPSWDVNGDGRVDILDLVLVAQSLGDSTTSGTGAKADVNSDGVVNIADLVLVSQHFGEVYNAAAAPGAVLKANPGQLPALVKAYNLMEENPSSDPGFLRAKELLNSLISEMKANKTVMFQNYPNPFNPETWIPFQLSEGAEVEIKIYNSAGQLIRALDLGYKSAGYHISKADAARWDGSDANGEKVSSGVYFYNVRAGQYSETRKMLLVK